MSVPIEPEFEKLLAKPEVNKIIEFLIRDQAFSVEFLASTIICYFVNMEIKAGKKEAKV